MTRKPTSSNATLAAAKRFSRRTILKNDIGEYRTCRHGCRYCYAA